MQQVRHSHGVYRNPSVPSLIPGALTPGADCPDVGRDSGVWCKAERSPKETFNVGKKLGEHAVPGQVFTLTGDLGVGKTVFTQGLAKGLGIEEPVNSPTFTIVQVYEEGRLPFYHFDVYRIGDVEEMDEVGFEDYVMGDGVSLIEWANLIEEILPEKRTDILIEKDLSQGFDYRRITIREIG